MAKFVENVDIIAKKFTKNPEIAKSKIDEYLKNYKKLNKLNDNDISFINRIIQLEPYQFGQIRSFEQLYEIDKSLKSKEQ